MVAAMMEIDETLAQRFRRLRENYWEPGMTKPGLSQDEVARRAGTSKAHIHQIEHGLRQRLQGRTLSAYSRALRVSERYLESGYEPAPQPGQEWPPVEVCLKATSDLTEIEITQITRIVRAFEREHAEERRRRQSDNPS